MARIKRTYAFAPTVRRWKIPYRVGSLLLMCALRLAQGEFLTRESGRRCLYLIDDFASELDDERRGLLASRLKATQSQVFVSAISAEHVIDMSDENSKMFTVEKGKITD